ncbi:threonine synthase [Teichococcus vastitatis]|uniref:Pyridoxal-phosphate dependent enzyme n=1 Tax=Teichococcus vastitatis TaxID=2307076 RepID=A0ABS9W3G5_9PROT|nr:pyridoxal-phosphate dependent enzyme [Pseudoroseomonas vastitatis]MCI0753748.1 pyridoxal-phosphate dependent enzyme [Pseudoroseomonas vastitatis]
MHLRCVDCRRDHAPALLYQCGHCGGILEVAGESGLEPPRDAALLFSMWRHAGRLAVTDPRHIVSMGEGLTPLRRAPRLEASLPGFRGEVWLKDETRNPSLSFKDRLVSAGMSKALELGARGVVCASSGNAGASTAAYAARAGVPAVIVVPAHTPAAKVTQIAAHGAVLLLVEGHYSRSYALARGLAERHGFANLTTTFLNPWAVDGAKLVGLELFEQLGRAAPDAVLVPTGSGPLVKGVAQGLALCGQQTRLVAVQAAGCAPIARAFEAGQDAVLAWDVPRTIASGISDPLIGYERDGTYTLQLVRNSGGLAVAVEDDALRQAMRDLARLEGVYAEPTAASPVAALRRLLAERRLAPEARVVCMITGHGFKDGAAFAEMPARTHRVADPEDLAAVARLCDEALAENAAAEKD